jgi:hypothetical protein
VAGKRRKLGKMNGMQPKFFAPFELRRVLLAGCWRSIEKSPKNFWVGNTKSPGGAPN